MPFEVQNKDLQPLTWDIFNELSMEDEIEGEMAYQTVDGFCTWIVLFRPKHPDFQGLFLAIGYLFEEGSLVGRGDAQQDVVLVRDGNDVRVEAPALASDMRMWVGYGPFAG